MDAAEWAVKNKDLNILMIAPTERQAHALFEKTLDYLITYHPRLILKGKDKKTGQTMRPTKTRITLKNGVNIYCLPVGISGIGIRFLTVGRLYVDEASRIPEEVWAAVTPMLLTTGGDTILLSTPFGARGEFYRCLVNQDGAYDSFKRFRQNSEDVMRKRPICDTWTEKQLEKALQKIEQARTRMSQLEFAQEYMGEAMEDLHRYFRDEIIQKCCVLEREGYVPNKDYYLGVDIARFGEDKSTFEIIRKIDSKNLIHAESIATKKTRTTETEDKIIALNKIYNFVNIYIDAGSGSLGVGVYDHLLRNEETKRKVIDVDNKKRVRDKDGKAKATLLKLDLYDNLRALMERGDIKLLKDDALIESLRSVQYEFEKKEGLPTRMRIFSTPHNMSDIVEGLIRAVISSKEKNLNIWIKSFKI